MDTTETLNGTYFYHGHANVSAQELFWLIFAESFAEHQGLAIETSAMIIAGWPILPKPKGLGDSTWGTSVASKLSRRIFKDMRFVEPVATPIGFMKTRMTKSVGAAVGRYAPYVGGTIPAMIIFGIIARKTRNKYNLIARPKDRIEWTYF
ncbi:hypothetical protein C5Y41_20400 [Rahnella variigena]|uniref:STM2901 family protein n=1 Tax=Rahnella variigena TaxID=574964 RepID=UPI00101BEB44|nr:hypothetical protein [Rahnella variigena]RYJ12655.1 hypothetical protein C5Y41_20400 [Rahnella variigena]